MCRYKCIAYSLFLFGMLSLGGCSSNNLDEPSNNESDEQLWISFNLTQQSAAETSNSTRAGETEGMLPTEYAIDKSTIVAMLFDTDANGRPSKVAGIAKGHDIVSSSGEGANKSLIINMGGANFYEEKHKYRLFVFANLPSSLETKLGTSFNALISTISDYTAALTVKTKSDLNGKKGVALGTEIEDALNVMVYLRENDKYNHSTAATAYIVQPNASNPDATVDVENPATLILSPLCSRLDFIYGEGKSDFIYPVQFTSTSGSESSTNTEVKVKFVQGKICNVASSTYLLPKVTGSVYSSPSQTLSATGSATAIEASSASAPKPFAYVPEFVPTIGTDKSLTFEKTTYMELDAILVADDDCTMATDVKEAINGATHPELAYYDDGTFQSALMVYNPVTMTGQHWIILEHETKTVGTESVSGYWVPYRHAIRHDAGTDASGKSLNKEDGVVHPMEYGIVRNYIYQIGIKSVSALPHPWSTSTPVESTNKDINITVSTPKVWKGWHRTVTEFEYK